VHVGHGFFSCKRDKHLVCGMISWKDSCLGSGEKLLKSVIFTSLVFIVELKFKYFPPYFASRLCSLLYQTLFLYPLSVD
jgi:hypothetical protein